MRDVEQRLRDLGERIRSGQPAPALEPPALRRIKRRRFAGATAGLLIAAALISVGTYALGALDREEPMIPPAEDQSAEEAEESICNRPVDFEPSYVPDGWIHDLQPGSGAGEGSQGVIGHYGNDASAGTRAKAEGGFADLFIGRSPYAISNGQDIRVLDEPAVLGDIHEGYAVEFTQHGCDYALIAYGVTMQELRDFAEGLRLPGKYAPAEPAETTDPEHFGAIWPEDTYKQVEAACEADGSEAGAWRAGSRSVTKAFGMQVLGWEDPSVVQPEERYNRQAVYELRRSSELRPAIVVFPIEAVPGCWSIGSVSRLSDQEPTGVSVSVRGREVQIGFDTLDAAAGTVEVGYGGRVETEKWFAAEAIERPVTFDLDFDPDTTGHFLILFEDEDGNVVSASGGPLPAGDFSAG